MTAIFAGLAFVISRLTARWRPLSADSVADAAQAPAQKRSRDGFWWLGLAGAALLMTRLFGQIIDRPEAFSQTYDNIFHLNAVRWILDHGDASSLTINQMTSGGHFAAFYPAAWHDLVSAVELILNDATITYASNAVMWLVMAVVWPAGCLWLAKTLVPKASPAVALGAAALAVAFPSFPVLLLGFGVLYPNFLGLSLLPAVICLTILTLRLTNSAGSARLRPVSAATGLSEVSDWKTDQTSPQVGLPLSLFVLVLSLGGMALAHPNTILSYVAVMVPLGLLWAGRGIQRARAAGQRRQVGLWVALIVGALAVAAVIWLVLRPPREAAGWPTVQSSDASIGEFLLASPLLVRPVWIIGILLVIGLFAGRSHILFGGLLGALVVVAGLWLAEASLSHPGLRFWIVGGYYNDPYRVAGILPVALYPFTVLGLAAVVRFARDWWQQRSWAAGHQTIVNTTLALVTVVVLVVTTQLTPSMTGTVRWVANHYQLTPESSLVDSDEYQLLEELPAIVPSGVRVATDPWNGSSMAYALEGVLTTTTHVAYTPSDDEKVLEQYLDEVSRYPDLVCPALDNLNVGYVLDFGRQEIFAGADTPMPGLEELAGAAGFTEVARSGEAVLYKIEACD
ncbi:MAG: hypothetical protein LBL92_03575 [Propionibacteriaceae bacterium]|nr:hypothetical protein [Propionibacteriaceae bacterium]